MQRLQRCQQVRGAQAQRVARFVVCSACAGASSTPTPTPTQQRRAVVLASSTPPSSTTTQQQRRAVLLAAAALLPATAAPRHAHATAAIEAPPSSPATCELSTAPSGLQWCDVAVGTGGEPAKGGLVKVHYTAALVGDGGDLGPEFDNSYKRGQPLIVKLGEHEVIEAFDAALLGDGGGVPPMREGGRRRIVVPPGLLQRQGTKSLIWVVNLSEALEEVGAELTDGGGNLPVALAFDITWVPKRRRG